MNRRAMKHTIALAFLVCVCLQAHSQQPTQPPVQSKPAPTGRGSSSSMPSPSTVDVENALYKEREMQQVKSLRQGYIDQQGLPGNSVYKPTPAQGAFQYLQNVQTVKKLYWQLENRLQDAVYACNFCALKQGELSMLFDIEFKERGMGESMANAVGDDKTSSAANGAIASMLGGSTKADQEDAFANSDYPKVHEELAQSCYSNSFSGTQDQKRDCEAKAQRRYYTMTAEHLQLWVKCFQTHNWVKDSSQRIAYENCLKGDPLLELCNKLDSAGHCEPLITSHNYASVLEHASALAKPASTSAHTSSDLIFKAGTRITLALNSPLVDTPGKNDPSGGIWVGVAAPIQVMRSQDHASLTIPPGVIGYLTYGIHRGGDLDVQYLKLKIGLSEVEFRELHATPAWHDQPGVVYIPKEGHLTVELESDREMLDVNLAATPK